jgi:elongation factor P
MISVTQLRQGVAFLLDKDPHKVLSYSHTHMGRGGGTIRVKIKNLNTGSIMEKTFKSGDKVEDIEINKRKAQYLYQDGTDLIFMDPQTFEQWTVPQSRIGEQQNFLKEGGEVWVMIWSTNEGDQLLDLDLPAKLTFTVKDAAPGEKGNSASNMYKDGILENDMKVRIPLFVNAGDEVVISTADGSYVTRA